MNINGKPAPKLKKLPPQDDTIFFHKGQIKVGTHLIYKGRLDPDSVWRVLAIYSYNPQLGGPFTTLYGQKRTDGKTKFLKDVVLLERIGRSPRGGSPSRSCSFAHLSYSAIWRLRSTSR